MTRNPERELSRRAVVFGALTLAAGVVSGDASPEPREQAEAQEPKIAKTPEEHFAKAAEYEAKAKEYRQEAALHKKILEAERNALPPKSKSGPEPGWMAKMRRHCEGYIQKAEALAKEADGFAEYHRMRGKEIQGQ